MRDPKGAASSFRRPLKDRLRGLKRDPDPGSGLERLEQELLGEAAREDTEVASLKARLERLVAATAGRERRRLPPPVPLEEGLVFAPRPVERAAPLVALPKAAWKYFSLRAASVRFSSPLRVIRRAFPGFTSPPRVSPARGVTVLEGGVVSAIEPLPPWASSRPPGRSMAPSTRMVIEVRAIALFPLFP